MSYESALKESPYWDYLNEGLKEHLTGENLVDASTEFLPVEISDEYVERKIQPVFATKPSDVRIPARLSNALIPYPTEIKSYIAASEGDPCPKIHGHHVSQLASIRKVFNLLESASKIPSAPFEFTMDHLKVFARQKFSAREDLINLATLAFAKRSTESDLSISAQDNITFDVSPSTLSRYTSFVIMIQRLRVHIAKEDTAHQLSVDVIPDNSDEASYTMFSNGVYVYRSTMKGHEFCIIACGGHFRIYHESLRYWFCGPMSYLDYIFTVSDVLNNIDILNNCPEYGWAKGMFTILIRLAETEGSHNDQVDFMKGVEGFLLAMSDYDEDFAMNWKPILEVVYDLYELDKRICKVEYDFGLIMCLLSNPNFACNTESFLCEIIIEGKTLSRTHLQEVSALHKLIFYSEVNAEEGVKKFLKRVHTPRKIDANAVRNITRLAKANFTIAYRKRHKTLPNIIGQPDKIKLLEAYSQRGSYDLIESLNLSWWDDIKIFDCMDNTLTDDPLEFAKDKGALKSEISFGPGDSRKELLQVIERRHYNLGDFFAKRKLKPKQKKVVRTNQRANPVPMRDAARLIEKEREQKFAARLFGNAGLENKHDLSLVAAKMKKALGYFDEQLMTPPDKKRKAIIHEASRELAQPDNYSLLLDIEGHNQSMQYENTSELAEFMGNLFGYDGWGDLPHYFSSLTVYHYDEYLDEVLVSEGQLGGIEGWLNPFWTLHTTLMMKLLRIMTDLDVKTIMVYSDDVNAIMKIKQASEAMVKSVFKKIMDHCSKFGMTIKYSQTNLSKHRVTMLRQHYADGIRADSTLKRLLAISAGNNSVIVSEELEVAGISSSAASALELTNHQEACTYLKNYKLGLLLSRLPQMILSHPQQNSMISSEELPVHLSNLLYYTKDDQSELNLKQNHALMEAAVNDITAYINRQGLATNGDLLNDVLSGIYGQGLAESRLVDSPDRVLYLQIYDKFLQDLLFFWSYLPCSLGGLGASLHINLVLSGHSVGFSKSLHYLYQWITHQATHPDFFLRYLSVTLSINEKSERNMDETRLVTSNWQNDNTLCPATTSIKQSIKAMVRKHTKNEKVLEMFKLSEEREPLTTTMLEIFRENFHTRIVQFYHENTAVHFLDLLIGKIETSSGLLTRVKDITRLRKKISFRTLENIRIAAVTTRTMYFTLNGNDDIIQCLLRRKVLMFPRVKMIEVEEVLYDDKIEEVDRSEALLTVRRCSPMHYRNGIKVYDDPKVGNETLYKGDLIDDDRMLGNKEELLAAKLVAVTKWFLMKFNLLSTKPEERSKLDCVKACNVSLSTLTNQTFESLFYYAPTETGGEILHRIPNMRFSTMTYIRAEMNRSLNYTTDLNQRLITLMGLVDSNVNFDYLRMRLLVAAITRDKHDSSRRLVVRYNFSSLIGIKDVQFVKPVTTDYTPATQFTCYSDLRNHEMSKMRFRYLSHSYMYEENVNEWALMPKFDEVKTSEQLGEEYIDDIILRYSKALDKEYLLVSSEVLSINCWKPLTEKLKKIDSSWNHLTDDEALEVISLRLQRVMEKRATMTLVDKNNKVQMSLQASCIEEAIARGPNDREYDLLVAKFSSIMQSRRHSAKLSFRLAKYQALLNSFESHKKNLARTLIMEYILTFHFKIRRSGQSVTVDADASVEEFKSTPLGTLSHLLISPSLQTRILVLGMGFMETFITTELDSIRDELREICDEVSLEDIILPAELPSTAPFTGLTGKELIDPVVDEIEYTSSPIGYGAMSTLEEISALCRYAQHCSITGASPSAFFSHTGSDSLGAQVALFRHLESLKIIDKDTHICDLTAGRGDGKYAADHLDLKCTSFSLEDTFTKTNHHPSIVHKTDYDVFDGSTLKFVSGFDFVHVDISFTGASESNLLDLVMFLEENNLAYSIRLNSTTLRGYEEGRVKQLPSYEHRISYAFNQYLKPYQIYLIGAPAAVETDWNSLPLRKTIAFKSLAISFSKLLAPSRHHERLLRREPNSASICFPAGRMTDTFVKSIIARSTHSERLYYCERYISEIGQGGMIPFARDLIQDDIKIEVDKHLDVIKVVSDYSLPGEIDSLIGNVSAASVKFHRKHLSELKRQGRRVSLISPLDCTTELLEFWRTRHPLSECRSWCNITLGVKTFALGASLSGFNAIKAAYEESRSSVGPKLSLHQRELQQAVKLLLLSAKNNNFSYGTKYLVKLMATKSKATKSVIRTLRCYRLLSYMFDGFTDLIRSGGVSISQIAAIENETIEREQLKYKYKRQSEISKPTIEDYSDIQAVIDSSMDELFSSLENYAIAMSEPETTTDFNLNTTETLSQLDLTFDIGIQNQVEMAIARLGLQESDQYGFIDIGDSMIGAEEDW
jgi:hypothetical protein